MLPPSEGIPRTTYADNRGSINPDGISLEQEKERHGCVIRSLESALEAHATAGEWGLRLKHLRKMRARLSSGQPVYQQDQANLQTLLAHLARSATPLGRAFRTFNIEDTILPVTQIKRELGKGNRVLVSMLVGHNGIPIAYHMTHLTLDENDTLRRASDRGKPEIRLRDETFFDAIIFSPKAK